MVYSQEMEEVQLAIMPAWHSDQDGESWEIPFSIEYGLTPNWQLEFEWSTFENIHPKGENNVYGPGNLELGTLYSFMNLRDSNFHLAPGFSIEFPTGSVDKEISEGFLEYEPSLAMAYDFPQFHDLQLFAQFGASLVQRVSKPSPPKTPEPAAHTLFWSGGAFIPIGHVFLSLEYSWEGNRWNHDGEMSQHDLTPGLTWVAGEHLEFGVATPIGLSSDADRFGIIAKFILEY